MKNKLKRIFYSDNFVFVGGLVAVPMLSFMLLAIPTESPLYTSISRIAWVHDMWLPTFAWGALVMGIISILTYRMVQTGPLSNKQKKTFLTYQLLSIFLVFVSCLAFPSKDGVEKVTLTNRIHDYLTTGCWLGYAMGLYWYSLAVKKRDKLLGRLGLGFMTYILLSSLFFLLNVIDPQSYVGASAVSEVCIINNLVIYLVVMYAAQKHTQCQSTRAAPKNALDERKE